MKTILILLMMTTSTNAASLSAKDEPTACKRYSIKIWSSCHILLMGIASEKREIARFEKLAKKSTDPLQKAAYEAHAAAHRAGLAHLQNELAKLN